MGYQTGTLQEMTTTFYIKRQFKTCENEVDTLLKKRTSNIIKTDLEGIKTESI